MCNISAYGWPVPRNSKIHEAREKTEGKVGKEDARWVVGVYRALDRRVVVVCCVEV